MMENIDFFLEDVKVELDYDKITLWLNKIAETHKSSISQINYIFCKDDYLLEINRTHLDHDYYTDIITFPFRQGAEIESDIYISIERVKDNAEKLKNQYEEELLRVIVHGLLHLLGYKDKEKSDAIQMRRAEEEAIADFVR